MLELHHGNHYDKRAWHTAPDARPGGGLHFPNLRIQDYRHFKDISIERLGRVTLITGKNNTGKSSVLEVVRLYAHDRAIPSVFVGPFSGELTDTMEGLWANVALAGGECDVVEALRIIEPCITAVSVEPDGTPERVAQAVVRIDDNPNPVPLHSFGDGINRLFAIALSLANARGGVLLIDEFENGLHYTTLESVWGMILRLAERLNIQVFATTQSWDAIEGLQKAAAESSEDVMLFCLTRWGDKMFTSLFDEKDLAVAVRSRINLR